MSGSIWVVLPLVCLAGGAAVVYVLARIVGHPALVHWLRRRTMGRNGMLATVTALAFVAATVAWSVLTLATWRGRAEEPLRWGVTAPNGALLVADPGALVIVGLALGLGLTVAIYSGRYLALDRRYETYYPLLLLLVVGLSGMVMANDLFNLYMFCELMSVAAYALVSFRRRTSTAIEAGFKYLIMGSVGTISILMGIAYVYRERGHLALSLVVGQGALPDQGPWTRIGTAFLMLGLAIKSAVVPVHTWLPDAHGRAPSSVSAMLSGIVIQSVFYAWLKIALGLGFPAGRLGTVLIVVSLFNMTLGNVLALVQTNTKRLLAYSTIAQMGYVMLSVGVGLHYGVPAAIQAGFFLLIAHAVMKGLAFLCKGVFHFYGDITTLAQLRGTFRRFPLPATAFGLALGGLAGVPPLAGFTAKWFVMLRILDAITQSTARLWGLYVGLVLLLLNGLLSLGYYLPAIGAVFARADAHDPGSEDDAPVRISVWMAAPLVALGGLVLAIGLYPGPWLDWTAHVGGFLSAVGDTYPK